MKIEHIAMYVNELEKARDFFIKYFGAVSNDGYHNKNTGFFFAQWSAQINLFNSMKKYFPYFFLRLLFNF